MNCEIIRDYPFLFQFRRGLFKRFNRAFGTIFTVHTLLNVRLHHKEYPAKVWTEKNSFWLQNFAQMTDEETNPFLTQEILVGGGGRDLKQSRKLVASILIAVAAVAALLVAFTASVENEHRILNLSAKRKAMLKDGTLKYGSLEESEIYGLFEDFKTTHKPSNGSKHFSIVSTHVTKKNWQKEDRQYMA